MAKFKVLYDFHLNAPEDKDLKAGEIVELTIKRANLANENTQKQAQVNVLERIQKSKEAE